MAENSAIQRLREVCAELELPPPPDFVFVDTASQTLFRYKEGALALTCRVSTSRFGIGNKDGSYMTPLGLHRVEHKIGDSAQPWTIFESREDTGVIWTEGMNEENQILSRIIRLRGLQPGVNAGPGIDSYERYIYIHGTNNEKMIGTPMSHGCVCMKNDDVINLYNMIEEGTLVYIN
ncbi:MAG: L,D-transpeptidase [Chitinispirillia bacterium]|nr:L,D-transpeptidase [Chitinispirillia bacterium]MCL2269083.1 L,D-transpeptidase [Chitinispirillia bacterium]